MNIENMKIISIDDNKTNLLIIESYAKILKLNISSFLNPLDAVDELEKNDYDLIIVDYMMPEMNGIEVIQKVRELGALNFVKKPIDLKKMQQILNDVIS